MLIMRDTVRSEWQKTILVCGKCSRKVGGGFGPKGDMALVKALKGVGNRRKGRKGDAGLIETRCLKLCPKNRVVAIDAAEPGIWHLIEPGSPIEQVAARLGLVKRHGAASESGAEAPADRALIDPSRR